MDKKSLIGNILIFIISAIMIYVSVVYLGHNNLMVGITGLFLLIAILNKDFSKTPLRGTLKICFLTGFIGIIPYLVNLNIYTGFFINFAAVFIMIYLVVYTLNKTIYFPFLFGYTLLLTTNVTGRDLGLRIVGLIVVGLITVVFQIIFIKLTKKKELENQNLLDIIDSLIININSFRAGILSTKDFENFKELGTKWSRDILEKRNNSFYLKDDENIELNLIASLEHIGSISKNMGDKIKGGESKYEKLLADINIVLSKLKGFLNKEHGIEKLDEELLRLKLLYTEKSSDIDIYEVLESLKVIDHLTDQLVELEKARFKKFKPMTFSEFIRDVKMMFKLFISDFNKNSVRFIFAFRTALLVAGAYFAIRYFNVPIGKWMVFTITSVSQPYNHTVKNRAKGRMLGTLVGVLIYLPLSMVFTGIEPRIIIIAIAVFFMINFKEYAYSTAMLTILFLGVVTIHVHDILAYAQDRVIFIALGIIAVLIGNKIIFPYSLEKETNVLIKKYYNTCHEIIDKAVLLYSKKGMRDEIRSKILIAKGFENKIILNNTGLNSDKLREFRNEQRIFLSKIQNILTRVEFSDNSLMNNGLERMNRIKAMREEMLPYRIDDRKNLDNIFKAYSDNIEKLSEKLVYMDMYEMIKSHKKAASLARELDVLI